MISAAAVYKSAAEVERLVWKNPSCGDWTESKTNGVENGILIMQFLPPQGNQCHPPCMKHLRFSYNAGTSIACRGFSSLKDHHTIHHLSIDT